MPSRLLARLDTAIAKGRSPIDVACLRAERAGFLARQGHVAQARKLVDQLQAQYALRANVAVTAWLCLAEGLHEHCSTLGPGARDRVQRAHALSGAAHLAPLHALSAAWLAKMDYMRHDMAQMVLHLREALRGAAPDHHAARSRACLVAAEAYHFAGRLDQAMPWYARSRSHAVAEGDEAHVLDLMHNQAWLRASQARLAVFFGAAPDEDIRRVLMSAESTEHYNAGVHGASLGSLVPMLKAQVACLDGRHAEALALYERHLDATREDGLERMAACFLADMAWCRWHTGDVEGARADARAAEGALQRPCDVDDRAMAQARLAQVHDALGDAAGAALHRERGERDFAAHRGEQVRLAALLDESLADLPAPDGPAAGA